MSDLVTWDVVILVLIILKTHDWLRDFNMKYSILSQIDFKKSSVHLIKFLTVKIRTI